MKYINYLANNSIAYEIYKLSSKQQVEYEIYKLSSKQQVAI